MAYITLRDVQLAFGGPPLDGANFVLERGERVCLIGRNGEGKSTLLKLIEGSLLPDRGEVSIQNGLTVSMLAQDVPMDSGKVADIVADGAGEAALYSKHIMKPVMPVYWAIWTLVTEWGIYSINWIK
jgi:ATP-binding cassette subfamily F protein uup